MSSTLVHSTSLERDTEGVIRRDLFEMAEEIGVEGFLHQQKAAMLRTDTRDALTSWTQLGRPGLVIGGAGDALIPHPNHLELHRLMLDESRLLALEDCGHMPTLEYPQEITTAMVDWLAR